MSHLRILDRDSPTVVGFSVTVGVPMTLCHHEVFEVLLDESVEIWTFDTGEYDSAGRSRLAYRLDWIHGTDPRRRDTVFAGVDFHASPMHAIDAPDTLVALLGFLTLRPGDTDATPLQREWAESYACEALGAEIRGLEEGEWSLPSIEAACERAHVEVFEMSDDEARQAWSDNGGVTVGNPWDDGHGNPAPGGWYYWCCLPGCLPESDPHGPFETRREAVEDAYDTFSLWDSDR